MRVVVAEYPKSGGTWVVSMLGDALSVPKRDIYVKNGFQAFDISLHPWYVGTTNLALTETCVIKSHELPQSKEINFPAQYVHLIRDGRDVVVSKYFFDTEFCVANGIRSTFENDFGVYLRRVTNEWCNYVQGWCAALPDHFHYEDFLRKPVETLHSVIDKLGLQASEDDCRKAVEANTREKMRRALDQAFKHNTFVRKGMHGDWRNHFTSEYKAMFKDLAGQLLVDLGYEQNFDW